MDTKLYVSGHTTGIGINISLIQFNRDSFIYSPYTVQVLWYVSISLLYAQRFEFAEHSSIRSFVLTHRCDFSRLDRTPALDSLFCVFKLAYPTSRYWLIPCYIWFWTILHISFRICFDTWIVYLSFSDLACYRCVWSLVWFGIGAGIVFRDGEM